MSGGGSCLPVLFIICRNHPNGSETNDPAENEALRRLRERASAIHREESIADQHLLHVQDVLRTMSEDETCKKSFLPSFLIW